MARKGCWGMQGPLYVSGDSLVKYVQTLDQRTDLHSYMEHAQDAGQCLGSV